MNWDDLAEAAASRRAIVAAAAAGPGEDGKPLDAAEQARWRKQALAWLRDDLAAFGKLLEGDELASRTLVRKQLLHWRQDPDLAGLRDPDAVARLPADEREACQKLWGEVEGTLKKAREKTK